MRISPKLTSDTNKPKIQEAQRIPSKINAAKLYPSISFANNRKSKVKRKYWKEPEGGNLTSRGAKIKFVSNLFRKHGSKKKVQ